MLRGQTSPLALLALLLVAPAAAAPPPSLPVAEVKAGMTGYGLSVFEGTVPERFPVRVVAVLHHYLPKQDLILIRSDDPRLLHSGVVAGMSGSPIYVTTPGGDRLIGALAYAWQFSKDPIAGVTPIENMLAELRRPLRGRENTPAFAAAPASSPPRLAAVEGGRLIPASVPLAVGGLAPPVIAELTRALADYHVVPVAASGAADGSDGPQRFEPGSAIAVQLVRGDVNISGTGTVTWVDGDRVLAFGHPMFNAGETYVPVATARVHTVMASLASSFKMASPIREVGTLIQDRQSCIVADTSGRSAMVPVRVTVRAAAGALREFQVEVVRHRFLTPLLTSMVVANAAHEAASDVSDATVTVRTTVGVRDRKALELVDHAFTRDGLSPRLFAGAAGIRAVGDLLFNPFTPVHLDRVDIEVTVDYRADVAEITSLALHGDELEPGSRPSLRVTLRPFGGPEVTRSVPIDIPRALAGQVVRIEAAAGNLVKPEAPPPEDLEGLLDNLRRGYPARSIVVTIEAPEEDFTLRGAVIADLPVSIADTLRPGATSRRGDPYKRNLRLAVPTPGVVVGKQSLQVRVRDLVPR